VSWGSMVGRSWWSEFSLLLTSNSLPTTPLQDFLPPLPLPPYREGWKEVPTPFQPPYVRGSGIGPPKAQSWNNHNLARYAVSAAPLGQGFRDRGELFSVLKSWVMIHNGKPRWSAARLSLCILSSAIVWRKRRTRGTSCSRKRHTLTRTPRAIPKRSGGLIISTNE
jgi:hypothetical protein